MALEYLHWADQGTVDLVRFRARGVLVLAYRDEEIGPADPLTLDLADIATDHLHRCAVLACSQRLSLRRQLP